MTDIKFAGSRFTKLTAEKNPSFSGKVELKTNIKIRDFEKIKESKDSLKVSYVFEVLYSELGSVAVEGEIFVSSLPKKIKELEKSWKDKKMDTQEHATIINYIVQKSAIKAFELEEELGLPIHIKLPSLSLKKE